MDETADDDAWLELEVEDDAELEACVEEAADDLDELAIADEFAFELAAVLLRLDAALDVAAGGASSSALLLSLPPPQATRVRLSTMADAQARFLVKYIWILLR